MGKKRRGRAYFRVACSVLHEPWDNDTLAFLTRLQAAMTNRWARDDLTPDDACRIRLTMRELQVISGLGRSDVALKSAERSANVVTMFVERSSNVIEIFWPKFAEFQQLPKDSGTDRVRSPSLSASAPAPAPAQEESEQNTERSPRGSRRSFNAELVKEIWPEIQEAFVAYGKAAPKLTPSRLKVAVARLNEYPDAMCIILIEAVHGRMRMHQKANGYDPLQHLTCESVWRPGTFWRDVEAAQAAMAAGERPPYRPKGGTR